MTTPPPIDLPAIDALARRLDRLVPPGQLETRLGLARDIDVAVKLALAQRDPVTRDEFAAHGLVLRCMGEALERLERAVASLIVASPRGGPD
jgi:hypothetical protein